ncbi:MAG: hypothetical protein O3C63_07745 [Cyanobacteria bacterium]|nr:hypothetical protein [Cyanobacteriota bacterium]MDA1020754.1 hypothetical protein [Cyanobacteriota bacterium]
MTLRKITISILLILLLQPALDSRAANTNGTALIGTWSIFDSTNQLIDTVDITFVVSKENNSRFSYTQGSHQDLEENSLQGFLFGDYIVFDLINMGFAQTYIAEIDFENNTGPGVEVKTQLAACTTVGIDATLVKKKHGDRLAVDSAQCNASSFFASSLSTIKFVKSGADINTVPTTNTASETILNEENKYQNKVEGIWTIAGNKPSIRRRLVIKDIAAHHLGYSFTYRLLNNSTRLGKIGESDFESADRNGFIVNNYMMINSSRFDKPNELFLLKLNNSTLKSARGKELRASNADCFPLKTPTVNIKVCTPNDSSSKTANLVSRIGGRSARKVETNLSIDF